MPVLTRLRGLDPRAWAIASWATPIVAPLMVGLLMATVWLLGKWPLLDAHEFALFVAALSFDVIAFIAVAILLLISPSSALRGLSVSIAGTSAMLLIGGAAFAFVLEGH